VKARLAARGRSLSSAADAVADVLDATYAGSESEGQSARASQMWAADRA
jgi:hypothetical protein